MNSPFANLFLAIQAHIRSVTNDTIYIDQDLGQLTNKVRPPVTWPCVLIDFENFRFKNLGENVQTARGTVVLRLGFAPHSNTTQATPASYKEQALSYFDLEWALHQLLHGWSPGDDFGSLTRTGALTQTRTDNYRVRELRYKIAFDDYSTKLQQSFAPASLIVTDEIGQ